MIPEAGEPSLPYPNEAPLVWGFGQNSRPRSWCLKVVHHSCWKLLCMVVVLLNCVALSLYNPCKAERDFLLVVRFIIHYYLYTFNSISCYCLG